MSCGGEASLTVITVNVIVNEPVAIIPLILAAHTLTLLLWLQVIGKVTVFEKSVSLAYIQTLRPLCFKGRKHWLSLAWSLYASVQPASMTLHVFYLNTTRQENRKKASLTVEMRCIIIISKFQQSQKSDRFMLAFSNSKFGHISMDISMTCTYLGVTLTNFQGLFR